MAISICFNPMPFRVFEADGDFAAGARGYFYLARTTTPLTVYTDAPLATPHTWPVIADAFGLFAPIYIAKGTEYKVRIEDQAGNILYAADGIDNPAEVPVDSGGDGGGGGGGSTVLPAQIHQTGDFIWTPSIADRPGWVRANGNTISGPGGSGPGNTANIDCQALFSLLWNTFPDSLCPVTPGGRGLNPAADWDASKLIGTLDMRGRGAAGLDKMGTATALGLIQKSTTGTTTNTSTALTVASGAGLCAGMVINAVGVPTGTTIVNINGTSILMSAAATATATGVACRFSIFADAEVAGSGGGENSHVQTVFELATHTHTVTEGIAYVGGANNLAAGSATNIHGSTAINNTGFSSASNLWTPTRLGTWWIKI